MAMIEKATYIKGLSDGLSIDGATKEGRLISALIDLVTDMARTIDCLEKNLGELHDYVEELDEDLGDVEELLCDDDDEDDCDGCCAHCDEDCECECSCEDSDEDDDEDGDDYFEVVCPSCGDVINFDESIDPEQLICPNCGARFECLVDEEDLKKIDGGQSDEA